MIPKDGYRYRFTYDNVDEFQVVYHWRTTAAENTQSSHYNVRVVHGVSDGEYNRTVLKVLQVLGKIQQLTNLQSQDPGWFLARAFMFTSGTASAFLSAICKNYSENISRLAQLLKGKRLTIGADPLPDNHEEVFFYFKS